MTATSVDKPINRVSQGTAFLSGVLAGMVSIAVMYSLRVAQVGIFVPELAVGALVNATPGNIESFFVIQMGELAKYTALIVAILVYLVIHGAYGLSFPAIQRHSDRRFVSVGAFALITAAFDLLVFMPLFGAGLLGTATTAGWVGASVNTTVSSLVYSGTLLFVAADFRMSYPERLKVSRRTFVKSVAVLVLGFAALAYGLDTFVLGASRPGYQTIAELFANEVTPNDEFYVVTKNLIDPTIDADVWNQKIDGEVSSPHSLSYQELLARKQTDLYVTFECVSNEVGGGLISNAKWSGIPLARSSPRR